jgi:hypothetical protein
LYRAASEKARAEKGGAAGGGGSTETGTGGASGSDKGEPIIDAEVVDDKK